MPVQLSLPDQQSVAPNLAKLTKLVNSENTVVFIHATWCGHCQVFKPEWETFKAHNKGKFNVVEIESAALDAIKLKSPRVYKKIVPTDGSVYFPMIFFMSKRSAATATKKHMYNGSRISTDLTKFVEEKTVSKSNPVPKKGGAVKASLQKVKRKMPRKVKLGGGVLENQLDSILGKMKAMAI